MPLMEQHLLVEWEAVEHDAGRVPNRHPSTPTCAVTNATAGIANTGGGGVLVKV